MFKNLSTSTKLSVMCAAFGIAVGVPVWVLLVEMQIAIVENAISLLLGRPPGPVPREGVGIGDLPPPIPPGLPASLLERRPDIVEAEQLLVSANADIGAARALFFPTIGLTGFLGGVSGDLTNFLGGQGGAVGPDICIEQVAIGAQLDAGLFERGAQRLGAGQAEHVAVHAHGLPARHVGREPVDVVRGRAGGDLHQLDAAARQLGFGLHPVAAVGPQSGELRRDDERGHRAGEAAQPFACLPALGQVFRQVRVG